MAILNTTVQATPTTVLTASGNTVATVLYLCNGGGSNVTFSVYVVPSGGSANGTNIIYSDVPLATKDTYVIDTEKLILGNGDTVRVTASSAGSVICTVSYIGI